MSKSSDKVIEIPLSKVIADYEWNARSGVSKLVLGKEGEAAPGETGGETEENEFTNLVGSIEALGQTDPVDVTNKDPKTGKSLGDKFFLISGFRRFRALSLLAEKNGKTKDATVRAFVKEMSPFEARLRNLEENLARRKLSVPDTTKVLVEVKELMLAERKEFTQADLAKMLGIGRAYVSRMFKVEENVSPSLLKKWHTGQVEVPFERMEDIANLPQGPEQEKKFAEYIKPPKAEKNEPKRAVERFCIKAEKIGAILGQAERLELFFPAQRIQWKAHVIDLVGVKLPNDKEPTDKQLSEIVEALKKGYQEARDYEPEVKEEEDENEEDSEAAE